MLKMKKVVGYDDIISFGKYRGRDFGWIAGYDPSYIMWLYEESIFKFDEGIVKAAIMDSLHDCPLEDLYWVSS
jgi:hypothetical protein